MWQTIGDRSFCSVHNVTTDRGIPCGRCVEDPSIAISDRDVLRIAPPHQTSAFYEERLFLIAERCEKVADDFVKGERSTLTERGEPMALAAKFFEVAARCYGRAIDVASKREARAELDELKKTIREMRGAH